MLQEKYAEIRADPQLRKPLAGGAVHSHPEQEEQMHRDYVRRAYASPEELDAYDEFTKRLNARAVEVMRKELGSGTEVQG